MRYFNVMGDIFRLTNTNAEVYAHAKAHGRDVDIRQYGRRIGIVNHVTDWSKEDWKVWLEEQQENRTSGRRSISKQAK